MKDELRIKKVIWSVDAFEEKEGLQEKAARILTFFQNKAFIQVEPVFVLSTSQLNQPEDFHQNWAQEFQDNLQNHLEEILRKNGPPHILKPKILLEPLASTSSMVETLLNYATLKDVDLLIVASHSRRGLDRFFLGSFAETLLAHAAVPVMVVGGAARIDENVKRVLFPTDFSGNSREVFRRVVSFARQIGAEVVMFHVVPMPARIVMDTGYYPSLYGIEGEMVTLEDFMRLQAEHQTRRAKAWADWAKTEGVACDFIVDTSGESVDDLICNQSTQSNCDMIVMEGQSGAIKTALLGSITRNVVRQATCPVLVFTRESLVPKERETEPVRPLNEPPVVDEVPRRNFEI